MFLKFYLQLGLNFKFKIRVEFIKERAGEYGA